MAESPATSDVKDSPIDQSRTRKRSAGADTHVAEPNHRLQQRVVKAFRKPSTVLGIGATKQRKEHLRHLENLLHKVVRRQDWLSVAGILAVLLKTDSNNPSKNRFKYSVLLELEKRFPEIGGETDFEKERFCKNVFQMWEEDNAWGTTEGKHAQDEYRYAVQVEYISLLLSQGNLRDAELRAFSLLQSNGFQDDPQRNMIVGLTFQQLWYSNLPEEMKWRADDEFEFHSCELKGFVDVPDSVNSNYEGGTEYEDQCYSDHKVSHIDDSDSTATVLGRDISSAGSVDDVMEVENSPQLKETLNFFDTDDMEEDEVDAGQTQYTPIFSELEGLESLLLPIWLPKSPANPENWNIFNDYFKKAVKYLQHALHSTSPVLAALHPLIKLLLIGGQVKEALDEIEYCCNYIKTPLHFRLKASLLQQFDRRNIPLISTTIEEILKIDPTCCESLEKLVCFHENDQYSSQSLLEMIALHLDATYGDQNIWREYATCFLKLSRSEEDRMSCNEDDEHTPGYFVQFNNTPKVFIEGESGDKWKLRCRWWCTRHFSHSILASEIAAGDLELITYKAASVLHMYGSDFGYFVDARLCLEKEENKGVDLLTILQTHIRHSLAMYPNFAQRN